jgi:hypothetical protein
MTFNRTRTILSFTAGRCSESITLRTSCILKSNRLSKSIVASVKRICVEDVSVVVGKDVINKRSWNEMIKDKQSGGNNVKKKDRRWK